MRIAKGKKFEEWSFHISLEKRMVCHAIPCTQLDLGNSFESIQ
jgi:hypothetical protein